MTLTQVGSAFIGDLTNQITIDKATGAYSRYGNIIHVTDGQTDDIRAIVTSKNVFDNEHLVNIKDHVDTFYAELIGLQDYDEHKIGRASCREGDEDKEAAGMCRQEETRR